MGSLPEMGANFFVNIYYVVIKFVHRGFTLFTFTIDLFTFLMFVHSHSLYKPNGQLCSLNFNLEFSIYVEESISRNGLKQTKISISSSFLFSDIKFH